MMETICKCGSGQDYYNCCGPLIDRDIKPNSALSLMKSRYVAYTQANVSYLMKTTHPEMRKYYSEKEIEKWAKESDWKSLEIVSSSNDTVEFIATYIDLQGKTIKHQEKSKFINQDNSWYYFDGEITN